MNERNRVEDARSPEDEELVRSALLSLRGDVEALVLAPVEEVKGRGRRRNRSVWLGTGAGLAAAASLVGAVALSGVFRPDTDTTVPAANTSTSALGKTATRSTSAGTSTASQSRTAGPDWPALLSANRLILPSGAEWQAAFGLARPPTVAEPPASDIEPLCNLPVGAGVAVDRLEVSAAGAPGAFASQYAWIYASDRAATAAVGAMTAALSDCSTPAPADIAADFSGEFDPAAKLWRFTSDTGTGWVALATAGRHVAYVELWDSPGDGEATKSQMARVARVAGERLQRYGGGEVSPTGEQSPPGLLGPPGRMPDGSLFVDPAAFRSLVLSDGVATESRQGEWDGSAEVTTACDADTSGDGRFALMKVATAGNDAGFFATQRVRQVASGTADAATAVTTEIARLHAGFADCRVRNGQTTTVGRQFLDTGRFVVTTTFDDGTEPVTEFVTVNATSTPGHVSTIVVSVSGAELSHEPYLAELDRLGELAADR